MICREHQGVEGFDVNKQMKQESVDSAVVLLSGGADSAALLAYVVKELRVSDVIALSFNYGQRHARELEKARIQASAVGVREHREIDIGFFGRLTAPRTALAEGGLPVPDLAELDDTQRRQPPTYVPHRNLVFLSLAAATAESAGMTDVFYGAQAQDEYGYWDCTQAFVDHLNVTLSLNRDDAIRVHAPFADKSKDEVLKIGLALGVDYANTWTCYRGVERPCGTCPSCVERATAFERAGVTDPLIAGKA